jgi:hypothetical protein
MGFERRKIMKKRIKLSFKKFATADDNNGVNSDGVATGPLSAGYKKTKSGSAVSEVIIKRKDIK